MAYTLYTNNACYNQIDQFHQMFKLQGMQFSAVTLLLECQCLADIISKGTYVGRVILNSGKVPLVLVLLYNISTTCIQHLFMRVVRFVDSWYIKSPIAVKE